jgi:amino acid adenylation domain-containing protein
MSHKREATAISASGGQATIRLDPARSTRISLDLDPLGGITISTTVDDGDAEQEAPVSPAPFPRLLPAQDRQRVLVAWNDTDVSIPGLCVHHLFEEQVAATPEAVAVRFEGASLSYRDLNERANRLAHYLLRLGVEPEHLVGICVGRSPDLLVALLAVQKAGGAFLLLDPALEPESLAFQLEDGEVRIVLAQEHLLPRFSQACAERIVILIDSEWQERIALETGDEPTSGVAPGNTACAIFVSESSARPRAVLLSHEGLANLHAAHEQVFGPGPGDRVLQWSVPGTEGCVFEVVLALLAGAALVIGREEQLQAGAPLQTLLQEERVTLAMLPPSQWVTLDADVLEALRAVLVRGEACPAELVQRWATPGRSVYNLYGSAEVAGWGTCALCAPEGGKPPIGRPVANRQVYLPGDLLQPVAIGEPGQICFGGVGIGRYHRRHELNAERFPRSPFGRRGTRLYLTGDVGWWRADGTIEVLGHIDHRGGVGVQQIGLDRWITIYRLLTRTPVR